jgi:DNA-binding response OmpR family regulator
MAKRILVFNDTEDILEAFRLILEDAGYETLLFSYAPHDIAEVVRLKPDLVILDLIFGQEKLGFQLVDKMKMNRETVRIPIIVCSAAINAVRETEGYLRGMGVSIVLKPFDIDVLLETVRIALESQGSGAPQSSAAKPPNDDKSST